MGFNEMFLLATLKVCIPKCSIHLSQTTVLINGTFTSADLNYVKRFTLRNLSRYIHKDVDTTLIQYHQDEKDVSIAPDHSILVGVDYFLKKQSTLSATLSNRASKQRTK
jgi:hypothetical protein